MNAVLKSEGREIVCEAVYKVRNIEAASYDEAKVIAFDFAKNVFRVPRLKTLSAYAAKEANGLYTVELR